MRALFITCFLAVAGLLAMAADRPPIEVDPGQFVKSEVGKVPLRRLVAAEISDFFQTKDTPKGIVVTILPPEKAPNDEDAEDLSRRIVPITLAMQRARDIQVELYERPEAGVPLRASLVRDAMVANGISAERITIAEAPQAGMKSPSVDVILGGNWLGTPAPAINAASRSESVITTGN